MYFKTLSKLMQPTYMRGERGVVCEDSAKLFAEVPAVINEMMPKLLSRQENEALIIHAQLCLYLADTMHLKAQGHQALAEAKWKHTIDYINRAEPRIHKLFDVEYFINVVSHAVKR